MIVVPVAFEILLLFVPKHHAFAMSLPIVKGSLVEVTIWPSHQPKAGQHPPDKISLPDPAISHL
jgi:hypothetical protein